MYTITVYPKRNPTLDEIKAFVRAYPDGEWVTASRGVIESDDGRVYLDYDARYRHFFEQYLDDQQRAELTGRLGFTPSLALHVQVSTAHTHSLELARAVCEALTKQWGGGWSDGTDPRNASRQVRDKDSTAMANGGYTAEQLRRFIEATGENDNIDAKAPLSWDGASTSACLAKDIAAFANSRDGGVIVIGKHESEPGKFTYEGLSAEEAASFDITKLGDWINSHFAPPVRFRCHRHDYMGRTFVVITITEFGDVPHICTKSFQDPRDPKKHLLREGAIYLRKPNAASAPIASIDELRELIGLATAKRSHELLAMFESLIKGRPLVPPANGRELYDEELNRILAGLDKPFQQMVSAGAWQLRIHPETYQVQRWSTADQLETVIGRRSVRLRSEFPFHSRGVHLREWGICNDAYDGIWTLARSGQFLCAKPFWENAEHYKPQWVTISGQPPPKLERMQWLDLKPSIFQICEMFFFLTRLAEEYPQDEKVLFDVKGTNLAGRTLVTTDFNIHFYPSEPCRASTFEFSRELLATELRADWEAVCAQAMKQFVDLFPSVYQRVSTETMMGWIEKFKDRTF